ncbi:MAG: 16S rRNA (cytidine(1402)-2'-O)-methyltransferase [Candidatus Zixiibacteriota bacterium]|nr:MAG: 16S rRNA (cytidine(1402)-2'-O)-methyltransferase [candidate division Zixibacteria bacterium]
MKTPDKISYSIDGRIYLVPTPIGNLGDITQRAKDMLATVDIVACEDTRVTGRLLKKLDIKKRMISYHDFNERSRATRLIAEVRNGKTIAVVSDAGSPGISDPAYRIVRLAVDEGLTVEALPGPNAIIPALTASGLPTDRFFFEGFLPHKSTGRRKRLTELERFPHTLVFYESPHRIHKCLTDMNEVLGDREACLAREISKRYETYLRGSISRILETIKNKTVKGELVLVISGAAYRKKMERNLEA